MNFNSACAVPEIVPKELWEEEYTAKLCIPSSSRVDPAKALLLFSEILSLKRPMKVLDAGCGNGRNAIYLAQRGCDVTALDFAKAAIRETGRRVVDSGVIDRVTVVEHFIDDPIPFTDGFFDFGLDAYTFCHFLNREAGRRFWEEMRRVVRPNGHLLSIAFSFEDEYYQRFLKDSPDRLCVCDPSNGIWKRLYSEAELKSLWSSLFEIRYFTRFEFTDVVLGKAYRRSLFASVLRRP